MSVMEIYQQLRCRRSLLAHHSTQQIANVSPSKLQKSWTNWFDRLEETLNLLHRVGKDMGLEIVGLGSQPTFTTPS